MDNSGEERRRESFKAYLELYKHMTTLSTAVAVLLVALYKEAGVVASWTVITLILLGISLFSSVCGILHAAVQIGLGPEDTRRKERPSAGCSGIFLLFGSLWFFVFGLGFYVIAVLGWR